MAASVGFTVGELALWMLVGQGSEPTQLLVLVFALAGLVFSTRYSVRTLRGLVVHKSGPPLTRRLRELLALLAFIVNVIIVFMVVGYGLIVLFSILNGGPIVATV